MPKAGRKGFNRVFVQGSTFVLQLNYSANNPSLQQAENHYARKSSFLRERSEQIHDFVSSALLLHN
jgi:hypothetical protein